MGDITTNEGIDWLQKGGTANEASLPADFVGGGDKSAGGSPVADSLELEAALGTTTLEVDSDPDTATSIYDMGTTYPRVESEYQEERPFDEEDYDDEDYYNPEEDFDPDEDFDPEEDGATLNSARTLYAEDYDYVFENGRRYCGDYYMPCDEDEQTRQWIIHSVYRELFHNEPTTAPLVDPKRVLDIGTGIGEWAVDLAERYPDCQVWGTDIAPLQPAEVPVNVEWNLEDAEADWARPPNTFDLIHLRNMAGAFSDWSYIYAQAFHCIRPGGWIEILDFDDFKAYRNFTSFYPSGSPVHILTSGLRQASIISGRRNGIAHLEPKLLGDAGFVDIKTSTYDLPLGPWEHSSIGNKWLLACRSGIEAIFTRALTRYLGMDGGYVRQLCRAVEDETRALADDPHRARGFAVKLKVVVARKPDLPGQWTAEALTENGDISSSFSEDGSSTVGTLSHARRSSEDTI